MRDDGDTRALSGTQHSTLDELYRSHFNWLVSRLRRTLGRHSDFAEDLAQETYLRVARYAAADAPRHPRALLAAVGTNLSRDHARLASRRSQVQPAVELEVAIAPDQEYDLMLRQAILALPDPYRDAFLLSRFSPLSNKEIAARLCVSVKTVEWRIARAIEICGKQLSDMEHDK